MRRINLRAMAKINLSLDVIGTRPDGYHDLRMVMQSVRLSDQVTVSPTRAPGVRMKTNQRIAAICRRIRRIWPPGRQHL